MNQNQKSESDSDSSKGTESWLHTTGTVLDSTFSLLPVIFALVIAIVVGIIAYPFGGFVGAVYCGAVGFLVGLVLYFVHYLFG